MGLLNQIWWLIGFLAAVPLLVPGAQSIIEGGYPKGVLFLALGLVVLLLPEFIRWRLLGGRSVFERVPLIGSGAEQDEE